MPPANETRARPTPGLPKVSVSDSARAMPVVAINVRLKQMRLWAQRRWAKGPIFDHEAWLRIYSEGIARRYGGNPLKTVILRDIRAAHIDIEDEETIDNAIECARRSFETCPDHSAWSSAEIGKRLGVTFIERAEMFTHLGCGEKTKEQIAALRREAKRARNAARDRRSGRVSQERLAPWDAAGVSRRTWFRKNAKAAHGGTEIGADRSKKENIIRLQKQCQPKIRVGVPKAPKRPSNESPLAKIAANPRDPIIVKASEAWLATLDGRWEERLQSVRQSSLTDATFGQHGPLQEVEPASTATNVIDRCARFAAVMSSSIIREVQK